MNYISFDHFFTILGNKQRVRILQLLGKEGPMNVSMISKTLNCEQSLVSHNLRKLLLCHFIYVTQDGKTRVYTINKDTVEPLLTQIEQHVKKYCVEDCKHWS